MEEQTVYAVTKQDGLFSDDRLLAMAEAAEKRINAVIKIKQVALKVTNERDWVNQDGTPYLMVSGAEKIGNLFDISWRFLSPEPTYDEESDGHYTYTYRAEFSMGGRTIEIEGSRSSRDKFFRQYKGYGDSRKETDVSERDNRRDVKMAALTNLLGNGITRLLGIRNLNWEDLEQYARIDREKVKGFEFKKQPQGKPPVAPPQRKSEPKPQTAGAPKELQDKLLSTLWSVVELRGQLPEEIIAELSSFTDKNGEVHSCKTLEELFKSDKWTQSVYGRLKKELTDAAREPGAGE